MAVQRAGGRSTWLHTWKHRDGAFTADGEPWEWGEGMKSMVTFTPEGVWQWADSVVVEREEFEGGMSVPDAIIEVLMAESGTWMNSTDITAKTGRNSKRIANALSRLLKDHPDQPIERRKVGTSYHYRWMEGNRYRPVEDERDL